MKVLIIGALKWGKIPDEGQSVKTRQLYESMDKSFEDIHLMDIDLDNWRTHKFKLIFSLIKKMKQCDSLIVLTAHNGIKVLIPLIAFLSNFFRCKIHFDIIGGWLYEMCQKKTWLLRPLKKFDYLWAETQTMKNRLSELGLNNVIVIPNYRDKEAIVEAQQNHNPFKLCFFSRVTKLKGLSDAVEVVNSLIDEGYDLQFDIYGPIDKEYQEEFENLKFGPRIKYMGCADSKNSNQILRQYDLQLFPSLRYYSEGIPGSIVDSYFAGLPVLASKWESFDDVVIDGVTGVGFVLGNKEDFKLKLIDLVKSPEKVMELKNNCIKQASFYTQKNAMDMISKILF